MKLRLTTALAMMVLAGGLQAATAADLPVKAPPIVPDYRWSGFYVGGNVGGAWAQNDLGNSVVPGSSIVPAAVTLAGLAGTGGTNGSSVIGGVQAGYNWQTSSKWVWGVEADISGMDLRENRTSPVFTVGASSAQDFDQVQHNWLATFRGRVGYAWDKTLWYATGGVAVGDTTFSRTQTWTFADACAVDPRNGFGDCHVGSASKTSAGAVVGAGVEWAFNTNWSAKVEYLHVWLSDSPSFSTQNSGANVGGAGVFQRLNQTISQSNLDIVRVGVNYHFAGPMAAKY